MTLDELFWHTKKLHDQLTEEKKVRDQQAAKQRQAAATANARARLGRR